MRKIINKRVAICEECSCKYTFESEDIIKKTFTDYSECPKCGSLNDI